MMHVPHIATTRITLLFTRLSADDSEGNVPGSCR